MSAAQVDELFKAATEDVTALPATHPVMVELQQAKTMAGELLLLAMSLVAKAGGEATVQLLDKELVRTNKLQLQHKVVNGILHVRLAGRRRILVGGGGPFSLGLNGGAKPRG